MSGIRLELGNPADYASPKEYIEQHLIPLANEMNRVINEAMAVGSTTESGDTDMYPADKKTWGFFDSRLKMDPKFVEFNGADYFSIPAAKLKTKQLKVQLNATVYVKGSGAASFRLVMADGEVILGSVFDCAKHAPTAVTLTLPFGDARGLIRPQSHTYYLQGFGDLHTVPVCRRFSLSFIYI